MMAVIAAGRGPRKIVPVTLAAIDVFVLARKWERCRMNISCLIPGTKPGAVAHLTVARKTGLFMVRVGSASQRFHMTAFTVGRGAGKFLAVAIAVTRLAVGYGVDTSQRKPFFNMHFY